VQRSFEALPPDGGLENAINLRLPKIEEWMGEPRGAAYTLVIEHHQERQQMRIRESDTHRYVPKYHQTTLVMPWGLTNTLVTLQYGRQLSRHLLLWFDALSKTWEEPLSHLSGTYSLVPAAETIHWDLVISVPGAQWEFHTLLE